MNALTYAALFIGAACMMVGYVSMRKATQCEHNNISVNWLFLGAGASFLTFALFPGSTADGKVLGFRLGGAIAALFVVWMFGIKRADKLAPKELLVQTIRERDIEIERLKKEARKAKPIPNCQKHAYTVTKGGKKLVLITGDIKDIKGIDVWVNSENTEMEMARFSDCSVSASIRYWGAKRDGGGYVLDGGDTIEAALKVALGKVSPPVQPASIFLTEPGELAKKGVKKIFHIAAVQGNKTRGYKAVDELESCVRKALDTVQEDKDQSYNSILFPLLATATGKGKLEAIAPRLIETALLYLEDNPDHPLDTVYFLTYTDIELETCQDFLKNLNDRVTLC